MSVIRIYRFENGAEVKTDNSLYENISAKERSERIKHAAEAVKKIYSENAKRKKEEKHEE